MYVVGGGEGGEDSTGRIIFQGGRMNKLIAGGGGDAPPISK